MSDRQADIERHLQRLDVFKSYDKLMKEDYGFPMPPPDDVAKGTCAVADAVKWLLEQERDRIQAASSLSPPQGVGNESEKDGRTEGTEEDRTATKETGQ